ncbi:MAG TPA: hypothetical protein VJT14_01550 [Candidatus Dormibacteraeota bacterium]|nr:hypothetical protein [Candidatus Dormibacteraeota bacterium]
MVPIGIIGWTGVRATSRSRRLFAGPLAGGLTGAVGGFVGGLTYFSFGKSALNIGVGLVAGTMAGVAMGFVGAIASSTGLIVRSDR